MPGITADNFWTAAGDGQLQRVKDLIQGGFDPSSHDEFGYTGLHAAISYGHIPVAQCLLDHGVNVDIEDFDKDTPLFVAETVETAQFLLDNGANAHHRNNDGETAAMHAFEEGWTEVAELLAKVTGEKLPEQQDAEADAEAEMAQLDQDALGPSMEQRVQEALQRIEEQGGVENEAELQELVAKMILESIKREQEQS